MAVGNKSSPMKNEAFALHGRRPGSAEPPSFNHTYQVNTPARHSVSQYHERLFSGPGTSTYNRPGSPSLSKTYKVSHSQSNLSRKPGSPQPATPKRGPVLAQPSFVDETLFGEKPIEPDFPAPWDDGKKQIFLKDATDYKMQNKLREQRERNARDLKGKKNTPMVGSHTIVQSPVRPKSGKPKYKPSEVDELLFGGNYERDSSLHDNFSWESRASPAPSYDPLDTGRLSIMGSRPPSQQGRPPSPGRSRPGTPSSSPNSPFGKTKLIRSKHNASFVDESLFGPKPIEPDFPAPWEKEERRVRPLLFDSKDYRVVIEHGRPGSAKAQSRPRSSSGKSVAKKPVPWR